VRAEPFCFGGAGTSALSRELVKLRALAAIDLAEPVHLSVVQDEEV
jgi:hypothetical protein